MASMGFKSNEAIQWGIVPMSFSTQYHVQDEFNKKSNNTHHKVNMSSFGERNNIFKSQFCVNTLT